MSKLSLVIARGRDAVPQAEVQSLYFDEIVKLNIGFDRNSIPGTDFHIYVQATVEGLTTTGEETSFTIHEEKLDANNQNEWSVEIALNFLGNLLREASVELSAVAVASSKPKKVSKMMEPFSTESSVYTGFTFTNRKSVPQAVESKDTVSEIARAVTKIPLLPVMQLSVRYVRPLLEKDRLIAQFDMTSLQSALSVSSLSLDLQQGKAELIKDINWPLSLPGSSSYAFCFNLQTLLPTSSGINSKATINLAYTVADGLALARTSWSTSINFAEATGPIPKTPNMTSSSSPALNKRANSVISAHGSTTSLGSFAASESASTVNVAASSRNVPLAGVTIFLTGPNVVNLGDEFEWKVMVINKSSRSRELSLSFYSREQVLPLILAKHEERALVSDMYTLSKRIAAYRSGLGGVSGVIPLMNELRIGQLGAQSCFQSTIRLLATERGLHSVNTSTVHDLLTGDNFDTGELLQVMVK